MKRIYKKDSRREGRNERRCKRASEEEKNEMKKYT